MYVYLLLAVARQHSRKADRPPLFVDFFSRKDFVQLKGKFRPLMSKYARLPEHKGVRVSGDSWLREQPIPRNLTWLATRFLKRIPLFRCPHASASV